MTENLYRKEALESRNKSLYGEIVLNSPPKTWWIIALLILTLGGVVSALFWGEIPTQDGPVRLIDWILK